jgi:anti-sigma-K factor RskA
MPDQHDELAQLRGLAGRLQLEEEVTWEQPPADLWDRIAADAGAAPPDAVPLDRARRRRRAPWLLGAAAAAVLAVVAVAVALGGRDEPSVVASAPLERLGPSGTGDAELVEDGGDLVLHVETAGVDAGDGFLEVWVIDPEVTKLVSLGPSRPDGDYDLPPGLDPEQFPVVDVSVEPLDGDPAHSGDSVLRGQLTF